MRLPVRLLLAASLAGVAQAASIGVNFVGGAQINGLDGGEMKANEPVGAPGYAQRNWNQSRGRFPNDPELGKPGDPPQGLKDDTGAPTTASVLWTVERTSRILSYPKTDEDLMRRGYLDTHEMPDKTLEVVVEGIPYRSYDLVVYVGSEFTGSRGAVLLGPQAIYYQNAAVRHTRNPDTSTWAPLAEATATRAEDAIQASHVVFRNLKSDRISFQVKSIGNRGTGLHGFQIRENRP